MKKARNILAAAVVLAVVGTAAQADFYLTGDMHRDVTSSHTTGILYNDSTADVLAAGYISSAYVNHTALLRVMRPSGDAVGTAKAYNAARINISSGTVPHLYAYDTSNVDISGGNVNNLDAYDTSTVNISGGSVYGL